MSASVTVEDPTQSLSLTALYEAPPSQAPTTVEDAVLFLSGKSTRVQKQLAVAMAEASAAMEFERAAALRDRIRALTAVQANQGINPEGVEEADVVALHRDAVGL